MQFKEMLFEFGFKLSEKKEKIREHKGNIIVMLVQYGDKRDRYTYYRCWTMWFVHSI